MIDQETIAKLEALVAEIRNRPPTTYQIEEAYIENLRRDGYPYVEGCWEEDDWNFVIEFVLRDNGLAADHPAVHWFCNSMTTVMVVTANCEAVWESIRDHLGHVFIRDHLGHVFDNYGSLVTDA